MRPVIGKTSQERGKANPGLRHMPTTLATWDAGQENHFEAETVRQSGIPSPFTWQPGQGFTCTHSRFTCTPLCNMHLAT